MKRIVLFTFLFMPYILIGQCVCGVNWTVASGVSNFTSTSGGICVNSEWTGFITDHLGGASICVTENGKWIPAAPALSVSGFSGNFDLGINEGGLVDVSLGDPVINLAGKIKNHGGSLICKTAETVTFGDTLWNNAGGLLSLNSGSLLTQNLLNSGIINLSCTGIEILGASNLGTININQDTISVIHNQATADGTPYLTSPIQIGVLNNFAQVNLLGNRVVELGLGCLINNDGKDAVMDFDVLGEAGIRLAGCTLNNLNGGRVLAGYLESAFGTITNASSARIEVYKDMFTHGTFNNNGYIGVGGDFQIGVPLVDNIPGINNNQIVVSGDILIKGKCENNGVISSALGLFEEGHIVESIVTTIVTPAVEYVAPVPAVPAVLGDILDILTGVREVITPAIPAVEEVLAVPAVTVDQVVSTLVGDDFLSGDGLIWLGTIPANILDVTKAVQLNGESAGLLNNTLVVGTDPEAGLAVGVFPVKLVSLAAKQLESRINIAWEATEYENFDSFLLEKSHNATSFEGIARVEKTQGTLYNHDDFDPKEGANYYRLKLIDTNGEYTYSKTIAVNYETDGDYFTFENPVRNNVINVKTNMVNALVRISDILGREISYSMNETEQGFELMPLNNVNSVILITLANERERFTKKAVMR